MCLELGPETALCFIHVYITATTATCTVHVHVYPASNFQRRFAMFRDVMRVKTSAREGSREVYILREVS